jgi:PAS domain S-box-containing protein
MDSHAIVISDPEGTIRMWSEGAERMFGYPAAKAIGQNLDMIIPEKYRERHWTAFHAAMQTGTAKLDGAAANLPVTRSDGTVVRYPGRFLFLKDGNEQVVGAMAIFAPNPEAAPPKHDV